MPLTYNDIVLINRSAPSELRPGERACVVGISEPSQRSGSYLAQFPSGLVYTVEFGDGSSVEIHETLVELEPG